MNIKRTLAECEAARKDLRLSWNKAAANAGMSFGTLRFVRNTLDNAAHKPETLSQLAEMHRQLTRMQRVKHGTL